MVPMPYGLLADLVVAAHLLFVLFAVAGGVLVTWWGRVAWLHVPAVLWAVGIEIGGWACPLTPLEQRLRRLAGEPVYGGDGFVAHYIVPLLYPPGLTRVDQIVLASALVGINAVLYAYVARRWMRGRGAR